MAKTLVGRYKFSVRDAAALTGVSKQRISQLVPSRVATRRVAKQAAAHREAAKQAPKSRDTTSTSKETSAEGKAL